MSAKFFDDSRKKWNHGYCQSLKGVVVVGASGVVDKLTYKLRRMSSFLLFPTSSLFSFFLLLAIWCFTKRAFVIMNCMSCIVVIGIGGHLATGLKIETSHLNWFESYGLETEKMT